MLKLERWIRDSLGDSLGDSRSTIVFFPHSSELPSRELVAITFRRLVRPNDAFGSDALALSR